MIFLFLFSIISSVQAKKGKNILFLLADDTGIQWNIPAVNASNIKRLASMGTYFNRAYTAVSSCSPSRSAILTGLPNHENGMYGLHNSPEIPFSIHRNVNGLPKILSEAGYRTGLVGKYHLGQDENVGFQYGLNKKGEGCWSYASFCTPPIDGRNITEIRERVGQFLDMGERADPFFLYVAFGDTHRCGFESVPGSFCEKQGSGGVNGIYPGWTPLEVTESEVTVPKWLPDNKDVREDLVAYYKSYNRLDQGVGMVMEQMEKRGLIDETLIFFFSDNGMPFPSGKTNLLEQGQIEPLIVVHPDVSGGNSLSSVVSSLDFVPTILEWTNLTYPGAIPPAPNTKPVGPHNYVLSGKSIMPLLLNNKNESWNDVAFGSHSFHALFSPYFMRSIRNGQYRLIKNLMHHATMPILEDVAFTRTWENLRKTGGAGWIYNITEYMHRPPYQMYDIEADPLQLKNLAEDPQYKDTFSALVEELNTWRGNTNDPWSRCEDGRDSCTR